MYRSPRQLDSSFWNDGWCSTSLSWMEIRWSICAMRELIDASASRVSVIDPSSTWVTNSLTMSLPRSRAVASFPNRPVSTICSSNDPPASFSVVCFPADAFCASLIAFPLLLDAQLLAQLVRLLRVLHRFHQHVVQLLISLQAAAQVGQLGAQIEQLLERL